MILIRRQKIWLVMIIVANLAMWIIPSDVVENIARDRHTLFGRYSREHFTGIIALAIFSVVSFYVDWSTGETYKRRWFGVMATLLLLAPALVGLDYVLRLGTTHVDPYVRESLAYHLTPNFTATARFEDKPLAARSYPNARAGYESIDRQLRTDARGFLNESALERCDVLVLGDSFAAGSGVSNEQAWPVRLAEISGKAVYSLAMSGYAPANYAAAFKEYGQHLKPKYVLCGLYEGNDFRSAKADRKQEAPSFSKRMKRYFKQSPIVTSLDEWMINTFGPINSTGRVSGDEILDWLPLAIPEGENARYYSFAPKQLRDMMLPREEFARGKHWLNARGRLAEIHESCRASGAQLVLVYCPTKAHVTLPVAADRLPKEKVKAYLALRYKKPLPSADALLASLVEGAEARESVASQWCGREGIEFVSLTGPLRRAALDGRQVYFTYDQHWTPIGHDVAAEVVRRFLESHDIVADR